MKTIAIIGGGIAGLTAGIFAQMNGYKSIILEKNNIIGGECTGWDRQGYHIDGCIHWLVGTKEGTPINKLWKMVGALEDVECYHPDSFMTIEHSGVSVSLYRDLDKFQSSWLEISSEDEEPIKELVNAIKTLQGFEIQVDKPLDLMSLREKIKYFLSLKDIGKLYGKYSKISLKQFSLQFKHPALRGAIASFGNEEFTMISLIFPLASYTKGQASIPYGGSRAFAERMRDRYLALGGEIKYNCNINKVDISNKIVTSISSSGKSYNADYYIAAIDAHYLYNDLLDGKYNDKQFEKRFNNPKDYPLASSLYISIGYQGKMNDIPRNLSIPIEPFNINNQVIDRVLLTNYDYEPSFSPEGHSLIICTINLHDDYYEYFLNLRKDKDTYKKKKAEIANQIVTVIEHRFNHMKGKLKVLDVATPITYSRYCNAYKGAYMAFLPTLTGKMMSHKGNIKGLNNLFLSGQWLEPPGGLPVALLAGKNTIMRIARKDGKQFKSE